MFGMLDYRAHKLYRLIFLIPIFFIRICSYVLIPAAALATGLYFGSSLLTFFIFTVISILIIEMIFEFLLNQTIIRFCNAIFYYLVDVIPSNNRTKDQAAWIVREGRSAELQIKFLEHPRTWSADEIWEFGSLDWMQRIFFNGRASDRLFAVQKHFIFSDEQYGRWSIDDYLKNSGMAAGFWERLLMNRLGRTLITRYIITLFGFFYIVESGNPF